MINRERELILPSLWSYCPWSTCLLSYIGPWKFSLLFCHALPGEFYIECILSLHSFSQVIYDLPRSAQPTKEVHKLWVLRLGTHRGCDVDFSSNSIPRRMGWVGVTISKISLMIGIPKASCKPQSSKLYFSTCVPRTWDINWLLKQV